MQENDVYLYRHINHAKVLGPGETHEDHIAEVHAKYARIDKGLKDTPPLVGGNNSTPHYRVVKADGYGWYDVVGQNDQPITDVSMRKAAAETMAQEKNNAAGA